jgi:hypothetical protein
MKKIIIILFLFLFSQYLIKAQVFFFEDFESGNIDNWVQEYVTNNWNWKAASGTGSDQHPPEESHSGIYNAVFFRDDASNNVTKLITPTFDLDYAIKPELSFYLAQYYYSSPWGSGNSKLTVYYRSAEIGNNWIKLKEFNEPIDKWEKQVVLIPDSLRYSNVQLAFEGRKGDNEHGTCIDDIQVIETGVIPKYVYAVSALQASQDIIPTNSTNNPILQVKFSVKGNDGTLILDSLTVDALLEAQNAVKTDGVKLFATESKYFNDTTPIGTESSFINGKAVFDNINFNLPFGVTYVWVTFDIPEDEQNLLKGKKVDAKISVNKIKVNNNYYPETELNPAGYREINKSLFFDNFENDIYWNLTGEFEIDIPKGLNGNRGNPDPTYAYSGKKILGVDLTGIGTFKGGYELNLPALSNVAKTDTMINATYYKNIQVGFYRWLNANGDDDVTIDISLDKGNTWKNIWENEYFYLESKYTYKVVGLGNIADREDSLMFRFNLGPTGNYSYSGWNIDNFSITGYFINNDIGITALLTPTEGCGHTDPEPVIAIIKNFGYSKTPNTLPVGYSIDNGETWVIDTLFKSIDRDKYDTIVFSQFIDITSPGYHSISVKTFLSNDEDTRNDRIDTIIFSSPTYTIPYVQNFEYDDDFWISFGENKTLEWGELKDSIITTTDTIIRHAYSGKKCFATNLDGNYPNNDSSWIVSPCFDFTGIDKPVIEFMLWADAEKNSDGLALYYSLDEGNSWNFIPTETTYSFDWDWYNNNNITSLGSEGWDTVHTGWFKTRQLLPDVIAGQNGVKFKILFTSNETIIDAGIAIDDIKIYEAPIDAGVAEIVSPTDNCYLSDKQQVKILIKNYGVRSFKPSDDLLVSLDYNDETVFTDTFNVSTPVDVGQTAQFTFSGTINMHDKQDYPFMVYTHINGDTSFYTENTYNDTLIDTITVYGEPDFTLGPDIGTLNPEEDTLTVDTNFIWVQWKNHYNDTTHLNDTFPVPAFPTGVTEIDFSVIVENDSACKAYDTVKVINSISDLGVTAATGIVNTCVNNQTSQILNVTVKNFSTDTTYHAGDTLQVGYQYQKDSIHIETITLISELAQNETVNYTFTTPPYFYKAGSYNLKVFSVIYADLNYNNDTTYIPINIYTLPEIDLGQDTVFTANAMSEIDSLNAYSDYFATYKWQDNSTDSVFYLNTNKSFKYFVEVTDTNSCGTGSDTLIIISDNWLINSIVSPQSSCSLSENENITIELINNSENTFPAGYKIPAKIIINDSIKYDTINLSGVLNSYDTVNYTFSSSFNMNKVKTYKVTVEIYPDFDQNTIDNKIVELIDVWGIYPVDLGVDSIITKRADTIILDAGNKYDTYTWQDNSSDRYYYINSNKSQTYSVSVTDEHGCSNSSDSVKIIAYDIGISEINNPVSSCHLTGTNRIRLTLHNFGPDNIKAGTFIKFYYRINNGSWIEKDHTMSVDLNSGNSTNIILYENINFDNEHTYTMEVFSRWDKDYFYDNDTARTVIYQYDSPVVELGDDIYTSRPDTVKIDAGDNYTTYTWQDGSNNQVYEVTKLYTSKYFVTVTNANGCFDTDSISVITYDVTVDSIYGLNNCNISTNNFPVIDIKVNGQDTLQAGEKISVSYNFNGNIANEEVILTDTLTSGRVLPYTFTTPFTITDTGTYLITCSVAMNNEGDNTNNSLTSEFRIGAYLVNLGDDIRSYNNSVILDAGDKYFNDFLWNTNETTQTITVTQDGKYKVTVTDVNGCSSSDSVNVLFIVPGYSITEITGLSNDCYHSNNSMISFTLENSGNDTILADSTITISYKVNSNLPVQENYTFTNNLEPNNTVNIRFTHSLDLSIPGEYIITTSATIGTMIINKDSTINTWEVPDVDLGEDIQSANSSETLDAGGGFTDYLWSTGATTQTITVTESGNYWVKVINNHGCTNSDTVNILFVPYLLEIIDFINPFMGCETLNNENVIIKIKNNGAKTIPAGSAMYFEYRFADNNKVSETNELTNDMVSNDVLTYTFSHSLSYSNSGDYQIRFIIKVENDTLVQKSYSVSIYEKPDFFDGNDTVKVNGYPYILNPGVVAETYLWNTGETTQTITVNNDGNYTLTITQINTCQFSDSVYVRSVTGITDNWSTALTIYPNPSEKNITVDIPENIRNVTIQISDINGKTVYLNNKVSKSLQINISKWNSGVYILKIFDNSNLGIYQIIKK